MLIIGLTPIAKYVIISRREGNIHLIICISAAAAAFNYTNIHLTFVILAFITEFLQ